MPFNPRTFSQPDFLKGIKPGNLISILKPCRGFLEANGLSLPESSDAEIDYLRLANILACPDERMDSDVVEGLHVISTIGTEENFDELFDIARRNFIEVRLDATSADIAARIWLEAPQVLVLKDRECMVQRRKKFETFRARDPEKIDPVILGEDMSGLEADLDGWFGPKNRGTGTRVVRKDVGSEIHFLIQHGQSCVRKPSRKGAQSTCTFFRPERTDAVIADTVNNELRINASSLPELRLYREQFGLHVFGDPEKFVYTEKYTLTPLQKQGAAALSCRDVGGIECVHLTEIQYAWRGAFDHVERHKAEDVFKALAILNRRIESGVAVRKAVFSIKLQGDRRARSVLIQPRNIAEYGRGEQAAVIERWLRARGFVLIGLAADDERFEEILAVA